MSAAQGEAINSPSIGELIYSLTDDGTVIDAIGFWYYDGQIWKPFASEAQGGINIYNSNGEILADRTVTLNGNDLSFGPEKIKLVSVSQRIGIADDAPEYDLDVNGNVRVRNISSGNVVALADGTLAISPKIAYGSVKESLRSTDHNGWYRLDGRALNLLPTIAQTNAAALGITSILPNSNDLLMKQGTPLTTGGTQTLSLTRANLPDYTMTATSTESGEHTHTITTPNSPNLVEHSNGNAYVIRAGRGTIQGTVAVNVGNSGSHIHSGTIPSGGTGVPINIIPESISYTYFIYLGQ
ncbi:MAG TPA: hypothetical protein VKY36_01120 [Moheibacter sp.]|nr:hypothetical protein [Moheibacter sp.]